MSTVYMPRGSLHGKAQHGAGLSTEQGSARAAIGNISEYNHSGTLCKPLCAQSYGHSSQPQCGEVATLSHDSNLFFPFFLSLLPSFFLSFLFLSLSFFLSPFG